MLAYLKGKVIYQGVYLIIDNSGVGYKVFVPLNILNAVKLDQEISLFLHHHFKQDGQDLYGFENMEQLKFFEQLLSVSGCGPKSSLAIISRYNVAEVAASINNHDTSLLTKVSGIGKKTAERIIIELKGKVSGTGSTNYGSLNTSDDEAINALISLGYHKQQAETAIEKLDRNLSLEDKIKQALKNI